MFTPITQTNTPFLSATKNSDLPPLILPDVAIIDHIFKLMVWGKTEEAERQLTEAKEKYQQHPAALEKLDKIARQARQAQTLETELKKLWQTGASEEELVNWLERQAQQPKRIKKHLTITLNKQLEYRAKRKQQRQANYRFQLDLPIYQVNKQQHRQNLRQLAPSAHWRIIIDETGTQFNQAAKTLESADKDLGRIVALVLPDNTNLPPLTESFHAVDASLHQQQSLLKQVLLSNSGIFGATVKDLSTYNWIGAIAQHTRWTLLMLPINGPSRVEVFIEQRAPFASSNQLDALTATLENELKLLAPARFANLHLTLSIMQKDHPYNGYVDAIANVWNSNIPEKRKMLARTQWQDHCLLQNTSLDTLEHRSV